MNAVTEVKVLDLLCEYVRQQSDGRMLDYQSIAQETGFDMSPRGGLRPVLFRALRRERGVGGFKVERGLGVRLSSATNAVDISEGFICGVKDKVERAAKAAQSLVKRHAPEMSEPDKKQIISHGAMLAAVSLSTRMVLAERNAPQKKEPPPRPALPSNT